MPRRPLIRTHEFPYHVTARSNNREWFSLPLATCWEIFENQLAKITKEYQAKILSFVLMSNHFHLLLWTPQANIDAMMNYFLREVSRTMGKKTGRINHIFGGRYKWCLIERNSYLAHAYRYVYRNPVAAGLVGRVERYSYSTVQELLGKRTSPYRIYDGENEINSYIPECIEERVRWLNTSFQPKEEDLIRRALRRAKFQFSKRRNDRPWLESLEYQK